MEERERRVAPGQYVAAVGSRPENEDASRRERELSYAAGDGLPTLVP